MSTATLKRWLPFLADPKGLFGDLPPLPLCTPDVRRLADFADRQGVLPTVARNFRQLGSEHLSAPEKRVQGCFTLMERRLLHHAARAMIMRRQVNALCDAFVRNGVPMTVLKGIEFAGRLYPDPAMRTFTDIDMLVPRSALPEAERMLSSLGYRQRAEAPGPHAGRHAQRSWRLDDPHSGTLELHWNVVNSPNMRRAISVHYEDLERDASGQLTPAALLLIAAVHGATSHRFDRLQLLCDMAQAARGAAGEIPQRPFIQLVRSTGASLAVAAGLSLAGRVLREPACTMLADAIPLSAPGRFGRTLLGPSSILWTRSPVARVRRQIFREMLKYA